MLVSKLKQGQIFALNWLCENLSFCVFFLRLKLTLLEGISLYVTPVFIQSENLVKSKLKRIPRIYFIPAIF